MGALVIETVSEKRVCSGACKKFQVIKQHGRSRYSSGQCRCQTCDIWMDHCGCHLQNGAPATLEDSGWFCNCCNYRVRRNPRSIENKTRLRVSNLHDEEHIGSESKEKIDLSYFNKRRAHLIKKIVRCLPEKREDFKKSAFEDTLLNMKTTITSIEKEFNGNIEEIIDLAYTVDPPNKLSMIMEFERIRSIVGSTPTKQEIEKHSYLQVFQYNNEFQSWEHLLERLGYDPWYRDRASQSKAQTLQHVRSSEEHKNTDSRKHSSDDGSFEDMLEKTNTLRDKIQDICKKRDMNKSYPNYTYSEMFQLLEKYLNILPNNEKYSSIGYFIKKSR